MNGNQKVIPISLGMVNSYLIKGKGNILVDAGMPNSIGKITEVLNKNNVKPQDVSLILLTHNHTDHAGGLRKLKDLTGAKVAVHHSEAQALAKGAGTETIPISLVGNLLSGILKNPSISPVEADILIDEEMDLCEYGIDGKVIHTPGHTCGSISVLLDNNEAIVGDMFTGRGAKASLPMFAANLKELAESINRIVELAPDSIYTSHGSYCTVEALTNLAKKI